MCIKVAGAWKRNAETINQKVKIETQNRTEKPKRKTEDKNMIFSEFRVSTKRWLITCSTIIFSVPRLCDFKVRY